MIEGSCFSSNLSSSKFYLLDGYVSAFLITSNTSDSQIFFFFFFGKGTVVSLPFLGTNLRPRFFFFFLNFSNDYIAHDVVEGPDYGIYHVYVCGGQLLDQRRGKCGFDVVRFHPSNPYRPTLFRKNPDRPMVAKIPPNTVREKHRYNQCYNLACRREKRHANPTHFIAAIQDLSVCLPKLSSGH